eukprot:TRINITY_DN30817_c0_g2_i1.p1 TRINITY_DN30817_c0_g2~~TRINITY_DN30817_c0_g2_i1.p1  ORF type:complete len:444 (-),score=92.48 TRINITY_DN30817_c0_g2_i1:11-1342(-)
MLRSLVGSEMCIRDRAWRGYSGPANLYMHVPFCGMKCAFCSLFTTTAHDPRQHMRYVRALKRELTGVASFMGEVRLRTIHLGGGTPSVLAPEQIAELVDHARRTFDCEGVVEVALEGTPASFRGEYLDRLRHEAGVTAVSMGVQSFEQGDLVQMKRASDVGCSRAALQAAVEAGFKNVTVDLINGLPGQTAQVFLENLSTAVELGAKTLQVYPLEVRSRTRYGRQGVHNPVERVHSQQRLARNFLTSQGFVQRALPTFGRPPNQDDAHPGDNWQETMEFSGVPTIGIGAGARSLAPDRHYVADDYYAPKAPPVVLRRYYQSVERGESTALNVALLDRGQQLRRRALLSLLTTVGMDLVQLRSEFNELEEPLVLFGEELEALSEMGYLEEANEQRIVLNEDGIMASSGVCLLYTSDAADEEDSVDIGGRRIIKKKKKRTKRRRK